MSERRDDRRQDRPDRAADPRRGTRRLAQGAEQAGRRFETGDFNTGAALVTQDRRGRRRGQPPPRRRPALPAPDRLPAAATTSTPITQRDVRLARRISELAAAAGVSAAAQAPDVLELALDTPDHENVTPFYARAARVPAAPGPRRRPRRPAPTARPSSGSSRPTPHAPDRQRWHLDVERPARRRRGTDPGRARRRRHARRRRAGAGFLGARGRGRQPVLHLHLAVPSD